MKPPTRLEWWLVRWFSWAVPSAIRCRCGRYWWTSADIALAHRRAAEIARAFGWDQEP